MLKNIENTVYLVCKLAGKISKGTNYQLTKYQSPLIPFEILNCLMHAYTLYAHKQKVLNK